MNGYESSLWARVQVDSLSRWPLQESLHRDDQLTQEALDDWPALGKLILHLDLQHVRHQSHEGVFLHPKRVGLRC